MGMDLTEMGFLLRAKKKKHLNNCEVVMVAQACGYTTKSYYMP